MHTTLSTAPRIASTPQHPGVVLQTSGSPPRVPRQVCCQRGAEDGGNVFSGSVTTAYSNPDCRAAPDGRPPRARPGGDTVGENELRRRRVDRRADHARPALVLHRPPEMGCVEVRAGQLLNGAQDNQWAAIRSGACCSIARCEPAAYTNDYYRDHSLRLTWQATGKDKLAVSYGSQDNCNCPIDDLAAGGNVPAPEATGYHFYQPNYMITSSWTRPSTNRLLLEAGFGTSIAAINAKRPRALESSTLR